MHFPTRALPRSAVFRIALCVLALSGLVLAPLAASAQQAQVTSKPAERLTTPAPSAAPNAAAPAPPSTAAPEVPAAAAPAESAAPPSEAPPVPEPAAEPAAAAAAAGGPSTAELEKRIADLEAYVNNGARADDEKTKIGGPGPGHNGWMMICAALVLFMTLPGLALFYGGLVRRKNVLSVMAQCLGCAGLVTHPLVGGRLQPRVRRRARRSSAALKFAFLKGVDSRAQHATTRPGSRRTSSRCTS